MLISLFHFFNLNLKIKEKTLNLKNKKLNKN
jgi:hypothetical protein